MLAKASLVTYLLEMETAQRRRRRSSHNAPDANFYTHSVLLGLPREQSEKLIAQARSVTLEEGQSLFKRGDPGDGCYWLQDGSLKVTVASSAGDERILSILGPGTIVGELAMVDGLARSATVVALRRCHLLFLSREAFQQTMNEAPSMLAHLVDTLVHRLRQADEEAAAASFLTVQARVARALLQLAKHLGEKTSQQGHIRIRHKLRQADLAALAGVARESASRTLSNWRREGVIEYSGRTVPYVIDVRKLELESRMVN
jgi:CRP/FNR family transcriptional regulator, cyclic AMP receptor protein